MWLFELQYFEELLLICLVNYAIPAEILQA